MKKLFAVVLLAVMASSCATRSVRLTDTVDKEDIFVNTFVMEYQRVTTLMVENHCACDENRQWTTELCASAAEVLAVHSARWERHMQWRRHLNKGEPKPEGEAPKIPSLEEMCDRFAEGSD